MSDGPVPPFGVGPAGGDLRLADRGPERSRDRFGRGGVDLAPRPQPANAESGDSEAAHRVGLWPPLVIALFAVSAVYAAVLAVVAHGAESVWGQWAAGGYGAGAVVAAWGWRRFPAAALVPALTGGLAIPAALLPANWGQTSEVRVVERAATLWLAHGTPYLTPGQLVSWRSYDPYLPGSSLFGLPHAVGLPGALGDPLLWFALVTVGFLVLACRIAIPGAAGRCARCRRNAALRALLLVACPVFALPMALGETDPPVIALLCLGLALAAGSIRTVAVRGSALHPEADELVAARRARFWQRIQPVLAGVAIGVACSLKATAWPALPVILALLYSRDGGRAALRFCGATLASFAAVVAITAPELFAHPKSLWQNLVAYPLGLSRSPTQAASPLPGHVLAGAGSLGHVLAIILLGAAALAVAASLVVRPPSDVRRATMRLAVALTLLFVLAPDARFGYFAYPLGILFWLAVSVPLAPRLRIWRRTRRSGTAAPRAAPD